MKKILLTIAFLQIILCNAQTQPNIKLALTPADELIKANNHFFGGILLTLGGAALSLAPSYASDVIDSADSKFYHIAGGVVSLAGAIYMIEAFSHIGNAGRLMKENKIGFIFNQNGIGLSYSLNKRRKTNSFL